MNKTPDLDPIVLDDIDPTSKWVEEIEDPVFEADFDFDGISGGVNLKQIWWHHQMETQDW